MTDILDMTVRELLEEYLADGPEKRELIVWPDEVNIPHSHVAVVEIHLARRAKYENRPE